MNRKFKNAVTIILVLSIFIIAMLALGYLIYPQILPMFILEIVNGSEFQKLTIQEQHKLSDSDLEKSRIIAQGFYNPNRFCEVYDLDGPDLDLGAADQQDTFYVRIVGRILSVFEVNNLLKKDWNRSYILKISTDDGETLVVYRGSIDHIISTAEYVQVEGMYLNDHGIHANIVLPVSPVMGSYQQQQVAFFGWMLFSSLILGLFLFLNGNKRQVIVPILLLLFFISGCKLKIETVFNHNQSGTINISIRESSENFDFAREIPGMSDYFDSLWTQLRDQGVLVEIITSNQQEEVFIQNEFGGFQQLMSQSVQTDQSDTWVYVREYQTDEFSVVRYFANVDTSSMISENLEMDAQISNEIKKLLNEIDFSYSVIMPSRLTYHNGEQENPHKAEWQLRMNDINQIVVETVSLKSSQ